MSNKRKLLWQVTAITLVVGLAMALSLAGCEGPMGPEGQRGEQGQQGGQGQQGTPGNHGNHGNTPYIGDCGNWHIGGTADNCDVVCTGTPAEGTPGLNSYLVIFNANGGRPHFDMVGISHGQTVAQPADPTRDGWFFLGWYTDNDTFTSAWDFADTVTTNVTLYARWVAIHNSIATVSDYLATQTGTIAEPAFLPVQINLGDMVAGSDWRELLDTLNTSGKFVALDLSASTMTTSNNEFITGNTGSPLPGMNNIVSIILPDTTVHIGMQAFRGCTALASITIPASVTTIGTWVFEGCTSLTSINVDANNPNFTSVNGVLYNKAMTMIIRAPQAGISSSFVIPASVTHIGGGAFTGCTRLTSIDIPNSVTIIDTQAFQGCTSLESVSIGNSVTRIGMGVFWNCPNLTLVTMERASPPLMGAGAISSFGTPSPPATLRIVVPVGSAAAYRAAENWNTADIARRIHAVGCTNTSVAAVCMECN